MSRDASHWPIQANNFSKRFSCRDSAKFQTPACCLQLENNNFPNIYFCSLSKFFFRNCVSFKFHMLQVTAKRTLRIRNDEEQLTVSQLVTVPHVVIISLYYCHMNTLRISLHACLRTCISVSLRKEMAFAATSSTCRIYQFLSFKLNCCIKLSRYPFILVMSYSHSIRIIHKKLLADGADGIG